MIKGFASAWESGLGQEEGKAYLRGCSHSSNTLCALGQLSPRLQNFPYNARKGSVIYAPSETWKPPEGCIAEIRDALRPRRTEG